MADNIFADDVSLANCDQSAKGTENKSNPFSFSNFLGNKNFVSTEDATGSKSSTKDENGVIGDGYEKENPYSFQNFTPSITSKNTGKKLLIIDNDDDDESSSSTSNGLNSSTRGNKVNEGDLAGWDDISESRNETYDDTDSEESEHLVKIENLSKENTSLRNELLKLREEFLEYRRTANKRVTGLQKELEKVRKKEAEETRDLDNVVRMVEENLQKTTTRAANAEATVLKLKEELRLLKQESVTKEQYDSLVLEHNHLLTTVQDKSRNVAQLMRTAAEKTAPHVKQLQSGVASLRFFAQQFDDICKVAEVPAVKKNSHGYAT